MGARAMTLLRKEPRISAAESAFALELEMLKVLTTILALLALSLAAFGANAKTARSFAGSYVGGERNYVQDLTITKRKDGGFDIKVGVGTPGCTGSMDARGVAEGDLLKARARSGDGDEGSCVFEVRRTEKGVRVEADACGYFHGAACDFNGDYREKR